MDSQSRRAQLEARNAEMRQQVESLLAGLDRQTAALKAAKERAAEVTGRASSADGLVRATVDATGLVTEVGFAPVALTRSTPDALARSVVAVIQQAAADARQQVDVVMARFRGNLPDLPDVFPEAPSLQDLLPDPPSTTHRPARPAADPC